MLLQVVDQPDDAEKKLAFQNELDKLGATKMVLLVLSEVNDKLDGELLMSYINFVNSLLDGGNNKV